MNLSIQMLGHAFSISRCVKHIRATSGLTVPSFVKLGSFCAHNASPFSSRVLERAFCAGVLVAELGVEGF
jgi:hypothetical protein